MWINVILSFLLTIGITWLLWAILREWVCNNRGLSKKEIKEKANKTGFFYFFPIVCFFVCAFWFVPQVIFGGIVRAVVESQQYNCDNTFTEDGNKLIDKQCQYFQDVLNGKYTEYESKIDIQSYLDD